MKTETLSMNGHMTALLEISHNGMAYAIPFLFAKFASPFMGDYTQKFILRSVDYEGIYEDGWRGYRWYADGFWCSSECAAEQEGSEGLYQVRNVDQQ